MACPEQENGREKQRNTQPDKRHRAKPLRERKEADGRFVICGRLPPQSENWKRHSNTNEKTCSYAKGFCRIRDKSYSFPGKNISTRVWRLSSSWPHFRPMRCRASISKTLRPLIEIYLLRVERQLRMQYREPPKMMLPPCGISVCPASRCEPDPAPVQYFGHPFGDVAALVNRTDFAVLDDFKVQVFACEDVITLFERLLSSLLHPPVLMFIALRCRNTFRRPDIEYLFCISHTLSCRFG